jgi:superfamily II DNA helicase RecQ
MLQQAVALIAIDEGTDSQWGHRTARAPAARAFARTFPASRSTFLTATATERNRSEILTELWPHG